MQEVIVMCYLGVGAYIDGKKKEVSLAYLWVGIVLELGFLWQEWSGKDFSLEETAFRLLPGLLFLFCARLTGEKVGYGDGILLLILGGCLAFPLIWYVWLFALLMAAFWAGILLCRKKANRNTRIPFIPFLWIANFIIWRICYG